MADHNETGVAARFSRARSQITARFSFRGNDAAAQAVGTGFGLALPQAINRATGDVNRAALKLGPDEWLLISGSDLPLDLEGRLGAALGGMPGSLVDVSHRQIGLNLAGTAVAGILNAAVPLDLSLEAFAPGMATRTIFEKAEIVLWRTGEAEFHLEVWRSFAPYVEGLLQAFVEETPGAA